MNRRPGQVKVTTEVAMCSFCGRPRTLRREEHVLGTLVRTIVTCETCHRTLSSTMGVAQLEPEPVEAKAEPAAEPEPAPVNPEAPARRRAPAKATTVKKPAAKRPAAAAKTADKTGSKAPAKRSTTKK